MKSDRNFGSVNLRPSQQSEIINRIIVLNIKRESILFISINNAFKLDIVFQDLKCRTWGRSLRDSPGFICPWESSFDPPVTRKHKHDCG